MGEWVSGLPLAGDFWEKTKNYFRIGTHRQSFQIDVLFMDICNFGLPGNYLMKASTID